MPRGLPSLGSLAVLAILIVVLVTGGGSGDEAPEDPTPATVRVTRVVDGDTIEVDYQGHSEDVRYIGVDTRGIKGSTG